MSLRAITRLFSLLPPTTVTRWHSTDAPILRHFKLLILRRLFSPFPRSLLPLFGVVTSFGLCSGCLHPMPPLPLHLVVWRPLLVPLSPHNATIWCLFSLTFLRCLRLKVLFGDMTILQLWLPLGLLLPSFLLSVLMHLPPLGPLLPALTLMGSMCLLLSWGVQGVLGVLASLVAPLLPTAILLIGHLLAPVFLPPRRRLQTIATTTFRGLFQRKFPRPSSAGVILPPPLASWGV
jgi:hypothetical protein